MKEFQRSSPKAAVMAAFPVTKTVPFNSYLNLPKMSLLHNICFEHMNMQELIIPPQKVITYQNLFAVLEETMSVWKEKSKILVTCPKGVSPYLKEEIKTLNFPVLAEWDTVIQTEGTLQDTMILNLHLRTAQRVLYQLETFIVNTPEILYKKINSIPWENLLHASGRAGYVCVTSIADNPLITDSRFVNVKVKDAIVDRVRDKCGSRPDSGPDKDKAVIHVYWKNNRADVYLAGDPPHRAVPP